MRTYADILRAQAGNPQQPHGSAVSSEPAEIANDPELQAARELLLRRMHGVSWADARLAQKAACAGHVLFRWAVLAGAIAFVSGFALIVVAVVVFDAGGLSCRGACETAWADFEIRAAFWIGVLSSAAHTLYEIVHKEREIRRLRKLSNEAFLKTWDRWSARRRAREKAAARLAELDYQAERTVFWTEHYRHRDGT